MSTYDSTPISIQKHRPKTLTYAGHTLSIAAWSQLLGIPRSTLYARWRRDPAGAPADILGVVDDRGFWRGHPVVTFMHEEDTTRYLDTLKPSPAYGHPDGKERPCLHCGLTTAPWPDDQPEMLPDPCLGYLPGVRGACCGHGRPRIAGRCGPGVRLENGLYLEGNDALAYFHQHGCTACPRPEEA